VQCTGTEASPHEMAGNSTAPPLQVGESRGRPVTPHSFQWCAPLNPLHNGPIGMDPSHRLASPPHFHLGVMFPVYHRRRGKAVGNGQGNRDR
jgi:hypothetical protein